MVNNTLPANIVSLTPLRGIAASLVAVFHFQVYFLRFIQPDQSMFIDKCYLMVDLFFIMSGFLIMHVYKDQFSEKISFSAFKKFLTARFARIYPLHFVTLLLLVALYYIKLRDEAGLYNPSAIASHIFLLHSFGLHNDLTWNIPSWSISAEWWSYVLFPVLCLFLSRFKNAGIVVVALLSVTAYILILFVLPRTGTLPGAGWNNTLDVTYDYGFIRSIGGFMLGMLLYLAYAKEAVRKLFSSDVLAVILILLLLTAMHKGLPDILFIPGFSILILVLTSNTGYVSKWFNNRPLTYLGDISYSVYMIHFLLITVLHLEAYSLRTVIHLESSTTFFYGLGICVLYFGVLLGLSALSYNIIEKPLRKLINQKWAGKKA